MRALIALIACASGCDAVFGLDRLPDGRDCVRVGHDEDGDGIDDACDPCPFSAQNDVDDDNDGIALACDPEPTKPNQVVMFSGFGDADITKFDLINTQITGDALHIMLTSGTGFALWGTGVDNVIAMAGVDIQSTNMLASYRELGWMVDVATVPGDVEGTTCVLGKHQVTSPPVDYVQLYDNLTSDVVFDTQPQQLPLDQFAGTMRADFSHAATPQLACVWSQTGGGSTSISHSHPEPQRPAGQLGLLFNNVTANVRYLFVVTKAP